MLDSFSTLHSSPGCFTLINVQANIAPYLIPFPSWCTHRKKMVEMLDKHFFCIEFGFIMWTIWSSYNCPHFSRSEGDICFLQSSPDWLPAHAASFPSGKGTSSPRLHIMCPFWAPLLAYNYAGSWGDIKEEVTVLCMQTPQSGREHSEIDNQNTMWMYHEIKHRVLWGIDSSLLAQLY